MPTRNGLNGPDPVPEGSVDCEPEIATATATQFELVNKKKPQNFLFGELVRGGELEFWIENLPKDGTGCRGLGDARWSTCTRKSATSSEPWPGRETPSRKGCSSSPAGWGRRRARCRHLPSTWPL